MQKWLIGSTKQLLLTVLFAATVMFILFGCKKSTSPELSFKSIDLGVGFYTGRSYPDKEPGIVIVSKVEEVDNPGAGVQLPTEQADMLRAVDYKKGFVVIVFRGVLGGTSPKYTVDILQVLREGDIVTIQSHFGLPGQEDIVMQAFSSPYHIIQVTKKGAWNRDIQFVLEVDGKDVASTTHFIP